MPEWLSDSIASSRDTIRKHFARSVRQHVGYRWNWPIWISRWQPGLFVFSEPFHCGQRGIMYGRFWRRLRNLRWRRQLYLFWFYLFSQRQWRELRQQYELPNIVGGLRREQFHHRKYCSG